MNSKDILNKMGELNRVLDTLEKVLGKDSEGYKVVEKEF